MVLYYACDQCDFEALGQMMMEWHTSTSHAQFSCEECDFIGKNKGGLTRHKKAKHENTKEQNHISPTPGDDRVEPSLLTINFPVHFPSISQVLKLTLTKIKCSTFKKILKLIRRLSHFEGF